ncbi:DUF6114 domain-containing protein, partial [Streptomyces boluensis]|uniref:DUF6114 domain-containing protein n=1 Tax=Streptomyces boluensis TaxID=1775135 RepID=UPI001CB707C4
MLLRRRARTRSGDDPHPAGPAEGSGDASGTGRRALGARVEELLPWPERRAALRRWRRRRPFWGGLLLIAAGAELLIAPLSPLGVLFSLGVGGIAAVLIGLALILAGGFLWGAPHARAYVSLNALLLSVAAFAVTNLGGFLVGSLLGVAGSALGFAWAPVSPVSPVRRVEGDAADAATEPG